jgi:hypothetical protein
MPKENSAHARNCSNLVKIRAYLTINRPSISLFRNCGISLVIQFSDFLHYFFNNHLIYILLHFSAYQRILQIYMFDFREIGKISKILGKRER